MSDIQAYKTNRIAELNSAFTNNYNIIIANFNNAYRQLIGNRFLAAAKKQQAINSLIIAANNQVVQLKYNLTAEIARINKMVISQPIINTNASITTSNKKNALLIGINYIGTNNELSGCINDVAAMETKLSATGFNNFTKLTDKTLVKPTKQSILNAFTNLLRSGTKAGDLLCFFYSGHGSYILDKSGDETDGRDEAIVSLDMNVVTDDELKTIVQQELKEGVTLLAIFDSCFSGSILDLKYMYNDSLNFDKYTEYDKQLETKGNVICLCSSNDNQTSAEAWVESKVRGALCACLTDVITDKNITWRNLLLSSRQVLKDSGYDQIPQLSSGKIMDMDTKVFI
jgi:hypothetical protein